MELTQEFAHWRASVLAVLRLIVLLLEYSSCFQFRHPKSDSIQLFPSVNNAKEERSL